ncbi:sensory histidine kinase DcuS [Tyzzerella nexilis]|uniref:Sensory histidine kinase DcuS n=1 Tax=[Clostridium] nexile TaxID=29361 RepID=A0A6N2SZ63_9FIRM
MERVILGVIANVLRTYAIYRFIGLFYFSKTENKWIKSGVYVLFVILTSGGYYLLNNQYVNIFTNLVGLVLIVSTYQGSIKKNVLSIISIYSVNVVIESLVFSIIKTNGKTSDILESVNECIVSIGILLFVVVLEKTRAIKKKEFQIRSSLWSWLISVPVISIVIILLMLNSTGLGERNIEIEIAGILVINLAIFYLYGAVQDYYRQKIEKEEFFNRMEIYANQLDIMKNSYQKIKELRHDMRHHLGELKYLANTNEKKQLLAYIEDMERHMINTEEYVSSGNKEIDGTLNYLLQTAKKKLKEVDVSVSIPENLEIHNYLFNVILGNLLENAIAAAVKTERKYLKIHIKLKQNVIYIAVENSYNGEVKIKDNKIMTSKKDKKSHGIGLESVKRMVEEMNGMLDIQWKESVFTVNIMFYLEEIGKQ